jgi:hypothetical protein
VVLICGKVILEEGDRRGRILARNQNYLVWRRVKSGVASKWRLRYHGSEEREVVLGRRFRY